MGAKKRGDHWLFEPNAGMNVSLMDYERRSCFGAEACFQVWKMLAEAIKQS